MKNLIIIGAGKFGREVFAWAQQTNAHNRDWRIKGFLDDRVEIISKFKYSVPIIATPGSYEPKKDDLFVCAIGDPIEKCKYHKMLVSKSANFVNIIHNSVIIGENVQLANGIVICPNVVVSCDASLDDFVSLNIGVCVGHDVVIGKYCQINPGASIGGGAILRNGVSVGSNATILPSAVIGENAVVGASSVVLKYVPPKQTVFGVPARVVALPTNRRE